MGLSGNFQTQRMRPQNMIFNLFNDKQIDLICGTAICLACIWAFVRVCTIGMRGDK